MGDGDDEPRSASAGAPSDRRRLLSAAAVVATASIFGLTYGLSAPLLALDLAERGLGEALIGLNAAMHAVGVLIVALVLPRLTARAGTRRLVVVALASSAAFLLAFPFVPFVALWYPLRLCLGASSEILFVISETWTNELADARIRGRVMAVYTAALSLGYAGGPLVLSAVGSGTSAYVVGAAFAGLAILPVAAPALVVPKHAEAAPSSMFRYARLAPIAVATTILNAAVETAGLSFLVLYAAKLGWSEVEGTRLVSTLLVGAIVLQLPIGWLVDHVEAKRLALVLAVLSALGALVWPWMLATKWIAHAAIFVWGGLFVGIYTVMLAIVGRRFRGTDLVGVYAVMGLAWGGGALAGPSIVGVAMSASPRYGLPLSVALACAAFATFVASSRSET